jgi:hypothetical protein
MSDSFDSAFWLFLALGWGFALVTILMSWWRVDHGLAEVRIAREARDEYADRVESLKHARQLLESEWKAVYASLRSAALENIADGTSLMHLYMQIVQRHSRHRDIEMRFPEMAVPAELASPEPPSLLQIGARDEKKAMYQ